MTDLKAIQGGRDVKPDNLIRVQRFEDFYTVWLGMLLIPGSFDTEAEAKRAAFDWRAILAHPTHGPRAVEQLRALVTVLTERV
jgi:hypothetical protein